MRSTAAPPRWTLVLAAVICGGVAQYTVAWGSSSLALVAATALFAAGGAVLARLDAGRPDPPGLGPAAALTGLAPSPSLRPWLLVAAVLITALASAYTGFPFSGLQIAAHLAAIAILV